MVLDKELARLKEDIDESLDRDEWDSARDKYIKALEQRLAAFERADVMELSQNDDCDFSYMGTCSHPRANREGCWGSEHLGYDECPLSHSDLLIHVKD